MVEIDIENLSKIFNTNGNRTVAVDAVDLTVEEGTFATLLGPSGCGKTTLLRMLAGLEKPTEGSIYFDGEDVTNVSVQDRKISMVFQSIALYPFKSVRENIEYGLKYTDSGPEETREKTDRLARMVGIETLMDKKPNQLSGGQRQRVALSRALIRDPTVFLLDEPMSDLDAALKIELRAELKELHNEFQKTTLYVTHDQEEAMTLSQQVIIMDDGKVQQMSPPFTVFSEPNNLFVAEFIGSPTINVFEGQITDDEIVIDGFDRAVRLPGEIADFLTREASTEGLLFGVRPSALEIVDETSADPHFTARSRIFEQMGDETVLHMRLPTETGERDVRALVPPRVTPPEGETVSFTFDLQDVHVFDGETEEAIVHGLEDVPQIANETKP